MSNIKNYKDLIVWQKAHKNDVMVIELIEGFENCIPLECDWQTVNEFHHFYQC